ncbi:PIN/TRAM domain-containing protein [Peptostreptococcus faecalis]|uniref:PIN/TRAM domain-containing protein n=1 Tax=Peptostreptococcus faecalis TaxID=2045015 RepID=UPI000C7C4E39|nr:PIN domain-containing protein [Peptostreptococcus faecalis]
MIKKIRRILFALVGITIAISLYISLMKTFDVLQFGGKTNGYIAAIIAGVVTGLLFFIIEPVLSKILKKIINKIDKEISMYSQVDIILGSIGLILGFFIAYLMSTLLEKVYLVGPVLSILAYIVLGLVGIRISLRSKSEIVHFLKTRTFGEKREKDTDKQKRNKKSIPPKILDTSVIIDGRIADICKTGFIEGKLVIPQFVLDELRHIADSADDMKRVRGRRGLDILNEIQEEGGIEVEVTNQDFDDIAEVDIKLLRLATITNGKVVTNDYNLNKVAQVQGVDVLNINELANAVKPIAIPGEEMVITIVKEGKENDQGVAYLDDGTMIVVENGKKFMGEVKHVMVTSILQTPAGRMIFAKVK